MPGGGQTAHRTRRASDSGVARNAHHVEALPSKVSPQCLCVTGVLFWFDHIEQFLASLSQADPWYPKLLVEVPLFVVYQSPLLPLESQPSALLPARRQIARPPDSPSVVSCVLNSLTMSPYSFKTSKSPNLIPKLTGELRWVSPPKDTRRWSRHGRSPPRGTQTASTPLEQLGRALVKVAQDVHGPERRGSGASNLSCQDPCPHLLHFLIGNVCAASEKLEVQARSGSTSGT